MKQVFKHPLLIPAAIAVMALASLGVFEFFNTYYWTLPESPDSLIEESLDTAEDLFEQTDREMSRDVSNLVNEVLPLIEQSQNRQLIFRRLENKDFWGVTLYRDNELWNWNGFHLAIPPPPGSTTPDSVYTNVLRRANLTLLTAQSVFSVNDQPYQLIAARKLSHSTNLPIAPNVNYNLAEHERLESKYPVKFSYSVLPPVEIAGYRVLSTSEQDSIGIVYAVESDFSGYQMAYNNSIRDSRKMFHIIFSLSLFILFVVFAFTYSSWGSLLFQTIVISVIWFAAIKLNVIRAWSELFLSQRNTDLINSYVYLGEYSINSLFLILLFLVTFSTLSGYSSIKTEKMQAKGMLLAVLYAIVQILLILFFVVSTKQLTANPAIPLLDLELVPSITSLFFYISGAVFFTAISGISLTIAQFLFKFERDKAVLIFFSAFFAFLSTSFAIDQLSSINFFLGWQFLLVSILFISFIVGGWLLTYYPMVFSKMSGFRRMMILLLFASGSIYTIIWNTTTIRADQELREIAIEYAAEADSDSESTLRNILQTVESRLDKGSNVYENPERSQARFEEIVESFDRSEWQSYTIDLHLIRSDGEMISDYSTSIDSPGWESIFEFEYMIRSHRGEQLRMETNRPIIWGRPMNVGENFRSFFRGWIPIYSNESPNQILAWVTGSIFEERPDFNKPIRALMAAATGEEWRKSFYMAEFAGNRVVRSATKGIYTDQPEYNRLSDIEHNIAMDDSIAYVTTLTSQGSFREILMKTGERNIVKVSTPKPGFSNHLFSFFRMFLPLLFFGLFVMGTLSVFGLNSFNLFSQSNRFQNRLIDGFTLATLLFLTLLMFATQYAISNQSEQNIERDLVNKLRNLSESIQMSTTGSSAGNRDIPLSPVASPLNVDAILYQNVWVDESTTPQIFQQHLIPQILPFNVYEFLYNRERRHILTTVQLGKEALLIGFRSIVDDDNEPKAAIAIPTFTQSPVYTEQLLETTSYLFGIYLAIFVLFTVGALIFSNQLTKPIELIQKGLNKISRGEQKTKIPVTSQDEVGALAEAYNQMVNKLDDAQKELIKAERESAWKEMAQQVAHEIKNPLTPMKLNLQHLQRQLEANPDNVLNLKPAIEKTASNIIEQIESLNKIASDFSKFSKPIREPFEPVKLETLIEAVTDLYRHDEGISINATINNGDAVLHCVPDEIRRVLINLVKNSIEASDNGNCRIDIKAGKGGEHIFISVEDNGSGIPARDHDNIFVPNFSTKSSGTGLGLAISKKIIDAHFGTINFKSPTGKGTEFTIKLPMNPPTNDS